MRQALLTVLFPAKGEGVDIVTGGNLRIWQIFTYCSMKTRDCSDIAEGVLIQARQLGMTHLAFTDHDTTAMAAGSTWHLARRLRYQCPDRRGNVRVRLYKKTGTKVHILGYAIYEVPNTSKHIGQADIEETRTRTV